MTCFLLSLLGSGIVLAQAVAAPSVGAEAAAAPAAPVTPGPRAPTEYVAEGAAVVAVQGATRTPLSLPGPVMAVQLQGALLYVARGPGGVLVYDVADPLVPRLVREVPTGGGSATGFHVADGQLWVVVVSRSAIPIDGAVGAGTGPLSNVHAPAPRAAVAPASPPRELAPIAILRVTPGTVELARGSRQGARAGDRVAIFRSTRVGGEGGEGFVGEELVAVAEIVAVKEDSALAEVGRGAEVHVGDHARPARPDQTASNVFPPRLTNVGEVSVVLRPLVNAGRPLGVGILGDVEATYWGSSYFAGLRLQPVGLGWTADGSIVSTAALAEGGYEGQAFAVGLGAGVSWVNGDADFMLQSFGGSSDSATASDGGAPTTVARQETHSALTLSQLARLGARDGLNLALHNLLILHEDSGSGRSGFIYGGTTARLAIPVAARSDLFLEGGGGVMGYWFAGAGVSTWLRGNGAPGSWRLSVSAGAAGISGSREVTTTFTGVSGQPQKDTYTEGLDIIGPMVSVGVGRRFAF